MKSTVGSEAWNSLDGIIIAHEKGSEKKLSVRSELAQPGQELVLRMVYYTRREAADAFARTFEVSLAQEEFCVVLKGI